MLRIIDELPDNVLGVEASGEITGADYEKVLMPALETKLDKHDKIRMLYHIGTSFTKFDAAAMWDDAKVGLKHLTRFERIAVVSDSDFIRRTVKAFGFMVPGEVRLFENVDYAKAKSWIQS